MESEHDRNHRGNRSTFEITVLGNGPSTPMPGKYHSSHIVNLHDHLYLVDCGEGTQKAMLECGINPLKLKAIFITHVHGDHMYGLFPLVDTLGAAERTEPLMIFSPAPMIQLMRGVKLCSRCWESYDMTIEEVDTSAHKMIYETDTMEVWTIPLDHVVPTCGYLFREKEPRLNIDKEKITEYGLDTSQIIAAKSGEDVVVTEENIVAALENGEDVSEIVEEGVIPNEELTYVPFVPRSYAYCTDTRFSEKVIELADGVDLLYHEATYADAEEEIAVRNGHSTSMQAAEVALEAKAKRLLIGHFSGRYKGETTPLVEEARMVFPNTDEARQGSRYKVGEEF